jgi:signal transduction histidine kinase
MTELRRVLGLLRDPGDALPAQAPQPRLSDLPGLVAAVRAAGLEAELSVTGDARPLDPGVELSGYRIVQEALSNVLRHAPDAGVRVDIGYDSAALTLCVVNGPSSKSAPASDSGPVNGVGHGLVGMRERVAMLGGDLSVGPRPDGGYGVAAVLPA